jgi:hypothetical protein
LLIMTFPEFAYEIRRRSCDAQFSLVGGHAALHTVVTSYACERLEAVNRGE